MENKSTSSNKHWWLLGLAAFVTLCLGTYGYYQYAQNTSTITPSLLDAIYQSFQLFTLEFDTLERPIPETLEAARWLAPLITFSVAIKGIFSLLRKQSKALLGLRNIKDHTIICGLSDKGHQIAKELLEKDHDVVVIDENEYHKKLSSLTEMGAISIVGNAQDSALLKQARLDTARYLFVVTGDDTSNINITHEAKQLVGKLPNKDVALDCYTHVVEQTVKSLFYNHPLFSNSEARFNAQLFNLYDRGARLIFDQFPPDSITTASATYDQSISLLIFGFNPLASSLIIHAATTGHYANGKKLSIKVVDKAASHHITELILLYPALEDIVDVVAIDQSIEDITEDQINTYTEQQQTRVIYICLPNDTKAIALAHRIRYLLSDSPISIVAGLLQTSVVTDLLCEAETTQAENVHFFPLIKKTISLDHILNAQQDKAARLIHEMYCESLFALGETAATNSSLILWENLSESMKDSNRNQADHLPVKLRAIDLSMKKVLGQTTKLTFTEEQILLLSEMEHRRWMAGKQLDGWRTTSGKKNNKLKLNPLIVDFDQLPEHEKQKDVETITSIPRLIELIKSTKPNN